MQQSYPTSLPGIWRESPGVAGGSKRTYEATFGIAMKGGRKYTSTAAHLFLTNAIADFALGLRSIFLLGLVFLII